MKAEFEELLQELDRHSEAGRFTLRRTDDLKAEVEVYGRIVLELSWQSRLFRIKHRNDEYMSKMVLACNEYKNAILRESYMMVTGQVHSDVFHYAKDKNLMGTILKKIRACRRTLRWCMAVWNVTGRAVALAEARLKAAGGIRFHKLVKNKRGGRAYRMSMEMEEGAEMMFDFDPSSDTIDVRMYKLFDDDSHDSRLVVSSEIADRLMATMREAIRFDKTMRRLEDL